MGHKTRNDEMTKKRRTRERADAIRDVHGAIPPHQADHMIPVREFDAEQQVLSIEGDEAVPLGILIGGITDLKMIRGSIMSLNVTTSIEFRHLLADWAALSRSQNLILAAYAIPRQVVFGDDDDEHEDDDGDA